MTQPRITMASIGLTITIASAGCSPDAVLSKLGTAAKQIHNSTPLASQIEELEGTTPAADSDSGGWAGFSPPYPDRQNPFLRLEVQATSNGTEAVSSASGVRLRGFVCVGAAEAVLSIGGEVVSLEAGEEWQGIEVVEIAPPRVTLKSASRTWNESLTQNRATAPTAIASPQ